MKGKKKSIIDTLIESIKTRKEEIIKDEESRKQRLHSSFIETSSREYGKRKKKKQMSRSF